MPATTPFQISGRLQPENFFGRTATIRDVVKILRGGGNAVIYGAPRTGKSSLLYLLFKNYRHAERDALLWFMDMKSIGSLFDFVEEFYTGLKIKKAEPSLVGFEKTLKGFESRAIVFIDNADRLAEPPFNDEALFAILATHLKLRHLSLCLAMTLPPESVFKNRVGTPLHKLTVRVDLRPFTPDECYEFIQQRLRFTGVYFDDDEIEQLVASSRGVPADLQRAAAELFRRKIEQAQSNEHTTGTDTSKRK
jgi:Cdc6-like AAA superfamily ATPase